MSLYVPLRQGTPYSVYLHALFDSTDNEFLYYGITKRGWNMRFAEHAKAAMQEQSRRLFPSKLNELIEARVAELAGQLDARQKLTGMISAICAVGLDENSAMDTEEYLVDKYSLSSKHVKGLNMIPGGREGIRALHKLSLVSTAHPHESPHFRGDSYWPNFVEK